MMMTRQKNDSSRSRRDIRKRHHRSQRDVLASEVCCNLGCRDNHCRCCWGHLSNRRSVVGAWSESATSLELGSQYFVAVSAASDVVPQESTLWMPPLTRMTRNFVFAVVVVVVVVVFLATTSSIHCSV